MVQVIHAITPTALGEIPHNYYAMCPIHTIMAHSLHHQWWNTCSSEVRQLGHVQPLVV